MANGKRSGRFRFEPEVRISMLEDDMDRTEQQLDQILQALTKLNEDFDRRFQRGLWVAIGIMGSVIVTMTMVILNTVDRLNS